MRRMRLGLSLAGAATLSAALGVSLSAYATYAKWASSSVVYYLNPTNLDVSASAAEVAVQAGADAWGAQSNANFAFVYEGRVNDTTTGFDNRNVVIFRNASKGSAIATTYAWSSNGKLLDADIIFWDDGFTFFTGTGGCSKGAYIEDIAAHEFGHALGMSHSDVSDATMYSTYGWCSQQMRSLASDDTAGVEALYPPNTSNTAPNVSISAPVNKSSYTQGTSISFSGSASDAEDGNISSRIVWTSSLDGQIGTGASFSRILSVGTHTIEASATDDDGKSASKQITTSVTAVANAIPTVTISAPADNTSVTEGASVTFSGSASDPEDGSLTAKIVWSSSLDGPMGMGGSVNKILSSGTHTVSATVTDTGGLLASAAVTVTVSPSANEPSSIWLSARGFKVRGSAHVDLTWTGATSSWIDVYRNGTKVATTPNSGKYTDVWPKKGGGSATYMVCASGTSECSNAVVASM